jgi:hypothetical protein
VPCDHMAVIKSAAAQQIKAYCRDYGAQVGLTLEFVCWGWHQPGESSTPYQLSFKVRDVCPTRMPEFSKEQIAGYATGETKTAIEEKIRAEFANVL